MITGPKVRLGWWTLNGWHWAGIALGSLAVLGALVFLVFGQWLLAEVLLPLMRRFAPNVDAPDNWAVALTCFFRLLAALATAGWLCFLAGVIRNSRGRESADA